MRSIIFTSALLIAAAPLFAAPPNMWFARTYGEAHLAKTPDLGRAKGTWQGGHVYGQIARGFKDGRAKAEWICSVECDAD